MEDAWDTRRAAASHTHYLKDETLLLKHIYIYIRYINSMLYMLLHVGTLLVDANIIYIYLFIYLGTHAYIYTHIDRYIK